MRLATYIIISFSYVCSVFAQEGNSETFVDEGLKRFTESKSGKIVYEITGDASGEMIYLFDSWGWVESTSRKMEYTLFGMKSEEDRIEFRDGDFTYNIDMKTSKGKQAKNKDTSDLLRYKSPRETIDAVNAKAGGTISGTDTVLNKEVNIWKFASGNTLELWEWKGIILKGKRKLSKVVYEFTATSIDLNWTSDIKLPDGIVYEN